MPIIHDQYRLVRELSTTLYGGVFVCEDTHSDIDSVASKVVIKQVSLDRVTSFKRSHPSDGHAPDNPIIEKEVGDLLRESGGHPNVVQYKDSFVDQDTLYLVMEHCADGDLHNYLSRSKQRRLSYPNVLSVLSQVAAGLAFLHEHGIAHRDISLENIMLHHGCCKLGDFGLATRARRAGGRLVGKKFYMAPEIVDGGQYDPMCADVWSLGIVVFVLLTGSPLVSLASKSVKAFCAFKRTGVVAVLHSWGLAASLPDSLLYLLSGMLEVDSWKRLTITQVLGHNALKKYMK